MGSILPLSYVADKINFRDERKTIFNFHLELEYCVDLCQQ